jgi:hypothetical protein
VRSLKRLSACRAKFSFVNPTSQIVRLPVRGKVPIDANPHCRSRPQGYIGRPLLLVVFDLPQNVAERSAQNRCFKRSFGEDSNEETRARSVARIDHPLI